MVQSQSCVQTINYSESSSLEDIGEDFECLGAGNPAMTYFHVRRQSFDAPRYLPRLRGRNFAQSRLLELGRDNARESRFSWSDRSKYTRRRSPRVQQVSLYGNHNSLIHSHYEQPIQDAPIERDSRSHNIQDVYQTYPIPKGVKTPRVSGSTAFDQVYSIWGKRLQIIFSSGLDYS